MLKFLQRSVPARFDYIFDEKSENEESSFFDYKYKNLGFVKDYAIQKNIKRKRMNILKIFVFVLIWKSMF